jgi:hypothetical protein
VRTRTFVTGLVVCAAVLVAISLGIHQANANHHRPEGAAERWLAAVSDTTRKGVRSDAVDRAEEIGPVSLAAPLLAGVKHEDKGSFDDLEVGKATVEGATSYVPYRLHVRNDSTARDGVIRLERSGDEWKVAGCCGADAAPAGVVVRQVPSEGGPPPSSAPTSLWLVAVLAGVGVTAGASLLVEWATRSARHALAA